MTADDLHRLFNRVLPAQHPDTAGGQHGAFLPLGRPVERLGLALEPPPDFDAWIDRERLDAVFLHRPWNLTDAQRARLWLAGVSVLAYHEAFDDAFTTGHNLALARSLGWGEPVPFAQREDGRPLGMQCDLPVPLSFGELVARLEQEFGGLESVTPPTSSPAETVSRAAVVGALTDTLVRGAHAAGVGAYVTGQWRQPAQRAVSETGLGVVAIGHRRSEEWGLHALARALQTLGGEAAPEMVF